MASITLTEASKLAQNQLVRGLVRNIVDVDPMFDVLPFEGIDGNALAYNRENVLGDVDVYGVGDTITARSATSFTEVTAKLTKIIGDAEIDNMIQATMSGSTDQVATQVAGKAKSAGRKFRDMFVNGTGTNKQFAGLLSLVDAGQVISAGANGGALTFGRLDEVLDMVKAKDGTVDFLQMSEREHRTYLALLRSSPGATATETMTLASGRQVSTYRGVPIFRNTNIGTNQTQGTATNASSVIAGCLEDGSKSGVLGLTARNAYGLSVVDVGEHQERDEMIYRVRWYVGLALYSAKGLAVLRGVNA